MDSFCHVFLSFNSETRNKFTCFLYEALKSEGFVAFMDKSDVCVGDEVDSRIREGIRDSMSAIIIFSQNFAYSTWCLDELVLILERKKNSRYVIIPIFYEVEAKDIKHQLGNYGDALDKHKAWHDDKVDKWREALVQVGNILGDHVQGMQSVFIQNTIRLFRAKLSAEFPQCRLPTPRKNLVSEGSSFSSTKHVPKKDKVVVYTMNKNNGLDSGPMIIMSILIQGNVVFEEKDCSKEPKYVVELEELVGKENVRFPMVIVNGKDFCGEEEVEGLDDFAGKQRLKSTLSLLYNGAKQMERMNNMMKSLSLMGGWKYK